MIKHRFCTNKPNNFKVTHLHFNLKTFHLNKNKISVTIVHLAAALLLLIFLNISCKQKASAEESLFTLTESSGINFTNTVVDSKKDNSFDYRNFYNGGGVAIGDINNDGLADVILTSNMGSNKLFLNKGNMKFEDITASSGMKQDSMWSTGVSMVDINGDGWLDMYICNSGHINDGNRKNKKF